MTNQKKTNSLTFRALKIFKVHGKINPRAWGVLARFIPVRSATPTCFAFIVSDCLTALAIKQAKFCTAFRFVARRGCNGSQNNPLCDLP